MTSNPSPRYILTVAEAFKKGSYHFGGISFGTGNYGDLEATFAAIYLDSGARSVVLDVDNSSGGLREPIVKVLALMRSMEFVSLAPITMLGGMYNKIGQEAHNFDSVFSFFRPDFRPHGRVGNAGLVSPEATLLDMPRIIGLLNGLKSVVKFGLSSCQRGFGNVVCRERMYSTSALGMLEFNKTSAATEGFIKESFEGPSLVGGMDNMWVGNGFGPHNGEVTVDPLTTDNYVLRLSSYSSEGDFFSPPITNQDSGGKPYVVKFRYLGFDSSAGGCIGYADATSTLSQPWALCDTYVMEPKGEWVSCQFVVPPEVTSFRIVVADTQLPAANAYFDDIQIASGSGSEATTCSGVQVPNVDSPGQKGYSSAVVDRLSTLLTSGRLGSEAKSIVAKAFDDAGSADDGLRAAQQLIFTTAEFHTTNIVKSTGEAREDTAYPDPTGKPYRAVIYLYLQGGCDSFNMLVPYTCSNNLYESYLGT